MLSHFDYRATLLHILKETVNNTIKEPDAYQSLISELYPTVYHKGKSILTDVGDRDCLEAGIPYGRC